MKNWPEAMKLRKKTLWHSALCSSAVQVEGAGGSSRRLRLLMGGVREADRPAPSEGSGSPLLRNSHVWGLRLLSAFGGHWFSAEPQE